MDLCIDPMALWIILFYAYMYVWGIKLWHLHVTGWLSLLPSENSLHKQIINAQYINNKNHYIQCIYIYSDQCTCMDMVMGPIPLEDSDFFSVCEYSTFLNTDAHVYIDNLLSTHNSHCFCD